MKNKKQAPEVQLQKKPRNKNKDSKMKNQQSGIRNHESKVKYEEPQDQESV